MDQYCISLTGMNASEILNLVQKVYQLKSLVLGSSGVMLLHRDLPNDTDHTSNQKFYYFVVETRSV